MNLSIRPCGDANFYSLIEEPDRWVAIVQFNGEILTIRQERLVREMAAGPVLLAALRELQANPNDPRAHRQALDAIKFAGGDA